MCLKGLIPAAFESSILYATTSALSLPTLVQAMHILWMHKLSGKVCYYNFIHVLIPDS